MRAQAPSALMLAERERQAGPAGLSTCQRYHPGEGDKGDKGDDGDEGDDSDEGDDGGEGDDGDEEGGDEMSVVRVTRVMMVVRMMRSSPPPVEGGALYPTPPT